MAPTGDHVISLIDEISYLSAPAPLTSQYNDINPEQFCNGDNRPADCGPNCMCTHKIDIPLNAVVEVVLVDEGEFCMLYYVISLFIHIKSRVVYHNLLEQMRSLLVKIKHIQLAEYYKSGSYIYEYK